MQIQFIPQTREQWFGFTVATILAVIVGWFTRRKREPVELDKLRAETRSIHISSEVASVNVSLDVLRELANVTEKAEQRREEWALEKEQLRGQVFHWKCKAEELDGELIDSRNANSQYEIRAKLHEHQIKKLKSVLDYHNISYAELDTPKGNGK